MYWISASDSALIRCELALGRQVDWKKRARIFDAGEANAAHAFDDNLQVATGLALNGENAGERDHVARDLRRRDRQYPSGLVVTAIDWCPSIASSMHEWSRDERRGR